MQESPGAGTTLFRGRGESEEGQRSGPGKTVGDVLGPTDSYFQLYVAKPHKDFLLLKHFVFYPPHERQPILPLSGWLPVLHPLLIRQALSSKSQEFPPLLAKALYHINAILVLTK